MNPDDIDDQPAVHVPRPKRSAADWAEAISEATKALLRIWFWLVVMIMACGAGYVVIRILMAFVGMTVRAVGL